MNDTPESNEMDFLKDKLLAGRDAESSADPISWLNPGSGHFGIADLMKAAWGCAEESLVSQVNEHCRNCATCRARFAVYEQTDPSKPPSKKPVVRLKLARKFKTKDGAGGKAPAIAPASARSTWMGRNRRSVSVLLGLAATICLILVSLPSDALHPALSSDSFAQDPDAALLNKPNRITHGGESFILRNKDEVRFEASHPTPLKYQWLLQAAQSTWLVASAGKSEKISYDLRQLDSDWGGADNRYEFLIVVTANELLPGWPEKVTQPFVLKDLFTADELAKLQKIAFEKRGEERNDGLQRVLRAAFDRRFGANQCWFRVYVYESENRS